MGLCMDCFHSKLGAQLNMPAQLLCKRYPPKLMLLPTNNGAQVVALFPGVDRDSSCGEFLVALVDRT